MIEPKVAQDGYPELHEAIEAIADRDHDHARIPNGIGFNGRDTEFGNSLARQPRWSPRQAFAAYRMLRTYKGQLQRAGIDYDALPEPEVALERHGPGGTAPQPRELLFSADDGFILRWSERDPALLIAVRAIPGRRFDADNKRWLVPLSGAAELQEVATRYQFAISPRADAALRELEHRRTASRATDADLTVPGLRGDLRPFQRAGVAYAVRAKRVFICDEMGLGKTVQALATIQAAGAYPAVVVCPASLKLNWAREARKWIPGRSVEVMSGRAAGNPMFTGLFGSDITIVNYDVLAARVDELRARGIQAVVFDESHNIKTGKAQRTKAASKIAEGVPYRIFLSGTPLLNRPSELITQLTIAGRLTDLGGWRDFNTRYTKQAGTTVLQELNKRLRAVCYVRRLKRDVLDDLPDKMPPDVVPMSLSNRSEYERAQKDLIAWLLEQKGAEAAEKASSAETLVRIGALRVLAAQGKMHGSVEWIKDWLDAAEGEKLVVFAHHREVQTELVRQFPGCAYLMGDTPMEVRQQQVDRFQTDPRCRLIVCSLKAGGVGITLTAASNVAFLELGWTAADMDQAVDRCHRIGQKNVVQAYYLLAERSIDDYMSEIIDGKRLVTGAVAQGEDYDPGKDGMLTKLVDRLLAL